MTSFNSQWLRIFYIQTGCIYEEVLKPDPFVTPAGQDLLNFLMNDTTDYESDVIEKLLFNGLSNQIHGDSSAKRAVDCDDMELGSFFDIDVVPLMMIGGRGVPAGCDKLCFSVVAEHPTNLIGGQTSKRFYTLGDGRAVIHNENHCIIKCFEFSNRTSSISNEAIVGVSYTFFHLGGRVQPNYLKR